MDRQRWAASAHPDGSSVSLLRAQYQRVNALLVEQLRRSDAGDGEDRPQHLAGIRDGLRTLFRIEQELLYPQLRAVLDPATLHAACYSHQRIEQHLRAVIAQDDGGPARVHQVRNLHHLVLAHQIFEERRLFGPAAAIDSAALYARIEALCNDEARAAEIRAAEAVDSSPR
jgi:hypothetical protein